MLRQNRNVHQQLAGMALKAIARNRPCQTKTVDFAQRIDFLHHLKAGGGHAFRLPGIRLLGRLQQTSETLDRQMGGIGPREFGRLRESMRLQLTIKRLIGQRLLHDPANVLHIMRIEHGIFPANDFRQAGNV